MRLTKISAFLVPALMAGRAQAFMEEGGNNELGDGIYSVCDVVGDLEDAQATGCNPWPDLDATYSYLTENDQRKSALHYNLTAALAVGAGFNRCAAYALAVITEATDVGSAIDQVAWMPFPPGVDHATCGDLLQEAGLTEDVGLDSASNHTVPGAYFAPTFTFRSSGGMADSNEIQRESATFHWNSSFDSLKRADTVICTASDRDPGPVQPNQDMLTLRDLQVWATTDQNPLNACEDYTTLVKEGEGPITRYSPSGSGIVPNSLGAFGIYLHAFQDYFSHRGSMALGIFQHTAVEQATDDVSGWVSGHHAGEYGVLPDGQPGNGAITVTTPASATPYAVTLHSGDTLEAIDQSYVQLKGWLALHPEFAAPGAVACNADSIHALGVAFAAIPNEVQAEGDRSGARKRSDVADQFFASGACIAPSGHEDAGQENDTPTTASEPTPTPTPDAADVSSGCDYTAGTMPFRPAAGIAVVTVALLMMRRRRAG